MLVSIAYLMIFTVYLTLGSQTYLGTFDRIAAVLILTFGRHVHFDVPIRTEVMISHHERDSGDELIDRLRAQSDCRRHVCNLKQTIMEQKMPQLNPQTLKAR
jgi:hypothetical protein